MYIPIRNLYIFSENVGLLGCGIVILVFLPAAFVDMSTDDLLLLDHWRQMKVYCAGIWHNIVVILVGTSCLYLLPYIVWPVYISQQGVYVLNVDPVSEKIE